MAKTTLICDIEYDPALTDPESLASAMDRVMETALSNSPKPGPAIVADIHDSGTRRRWVLYDLDSDCLLTTRTYDTYQEAADDASQANDVLILQVTIQGISG